MKTLAHYGTIVPECRSLTRPGHRSRSIRPALTLILGLTLTLLLGLGLTACAPTPPSESPSIRGEVTSAELDADAEGDAGSILVEGEIEEDTSFDKASVRITQDTQVFAEDGTLAAAGDISVGQRVEVWFTGPVAESYPVQATASDVRILGGEAP